MHTLPSTHTHTHMHTHAHTHTHMHTHAHTHTHTHTHRGVPTFWVNVCTKAQSSVQIELQLLWVLKALWPILCVHAEDEARLRVGLGAVAQSVGHQALVVTCHAKRMQKVKLQRVLVDDVVGFAPHQVTIYLLKASQVTPGILVPDKQTQTQSTISYT